MEYEGKMKYHIVESRDIQGNPMWLAYPDKDGKFEIGTHLCVSADGPEECETRLRLVLQAPRIVETLEI